MSEQVTVSVQVEQSFKTWNVPNFACPAGREGGVPVDELPQAALDTLAQTWLNQLYAKAGKSSPFRKVAF